ncbi:hypothetical protein FFF34_010835 [Inquilinus sp. KBS0705]|nr:hypothetical protein FFF34_010835 [Inquilinus sp. KBS0705]
MKQKIFTFLLIAIAGLTACKKTADKEIDIKEYDEQQIQKYIAANSLTGFTRDPISQGDTAGIYYKIIQEGTGAPLEYPDQISAVFTVKSFDGKYSSADTIANHFVDYVGLLKANSRTQGLQLALHNLLKHKGGSMRLLIPSHLAYGVNGIGSGSVTNVNTRIAGNQCLDYYINVVQDQKTYDDISIKKYLAANGLTGYSKSALGCYYKILTPGTGIGGPIKEFSSFTTTYYGVLFNGTEFDNGNKTDANTTPFTLINYIPGAKEILEKYATAGTSISFIVPSVQGYGKIAQATIPANSCLRFEYQIKTVTQ